MTEVALSLQGLRKVFGEVVACDDLTFSFPSGQILGVVGPDGAGKTTALRMLCGLLAPTAGTAVVAGRDIVADPEAARQFIGYLPQQFSLHRDLTVLENLRYVADLYALPRGEWEQRRDELLKITYLAPFGDRLAGRLSGGMRQKLALVAALIHRPTVLLLDEPTTGVDPLSRRDFWKILHDLPRQGVTVVISTPYMDEALRCHRLAFLHEGRLLAYDTPEALLRSLSGTMLEVRCEPQREGRNILRRMDEIQFVETFGDRLHVAVRSENDLPRVREALLAAGLKCAGLEAIKPSLEDVFLARTVTPH